MGSQNRQPAGVGTRQPPKETGELVLGLRAFLGQPLTQFVEAVPVNQKGSGITIGAVKWGVYAFFDYDDEPIYVGQTRESLGQRISRHLTNQRTDAVAMAVLDPFEVLTIKVWPLPEYQNSSSKDPTASRHLNALEHHVFLELIADSKFGKILNEKDPASAGSCAVPIVICGQIVPDSIKDVRGHPDTRLARRAMTIARLAQIVSGRQVGVGLRRTLATQADRLAWLAAARFAALGGEDAVETDLGEKAARLHP
jgi:hypothetical protein